VPKLPPRMRLSHGAYYHASYTTIDGVRRQKWLRLGADYGKAIRKYAEIEAAREHGAQDYRALWAAYRLHELPKKALTTRKNYTIWGDYLLDVFGDMLPGDIRQSHAQGILDRAKHPVTAQRMVQLLSGVLAWGAARDWLTVNPLLGFRKGAKARRTRYITDGELGAILAACDADLALLVRFMHYTALRRSDVLGLRWADVRDDGLHIVMQKTKAAIHLHWTPELRAMLAEARRRPVVGLYVFADARGRRLPVEREWRRFKAAAARAKVAGVTFHDLRRKRLTDLQVDGEQQLAQRLAGHADPRTTQGYYAAPETPVRLK
jgi:integrase